MSDANLDISCPDLLYSRTDVAPTGDMIVRRSTRLSGVEQQRFSPMPDPDEVYGASLLVMFLN